SWREVSHRHAAPRRRRRALGRVRGHRAAIAPLFHLDLGQYRPPAHPGHGEARGPRRQHRVDPDPPPAPAQPGGRAPQGLDSNCRGTRADAHIVRETNPTGARRGPFLAVWVAMMGAMMIPSLVPTLTRDRPALESPPSGPAPDRLAALGGGGEGGGGLLRSVGDDGRGGLRREYRGGGCGAAVADAGP